MRIMVGVGHPKHVHFWKNIVRNLENKGHEVKIVARDKDLTLYLLDAFGLKYDIVGKNYKGLIKKAHGMLKVEFKLLKIAKEFKPDILAAGAPYLAHVSKLIGKPYICFTDSEPANLVSWLSFPFSNVICTPSCFRRRVNPKKHVAYNGYEELAYLHPSYFNPDLSVLDDLGLNKDDKFVIIRFVAWQASHDIGRKGLGVGTKRAFVNELEKYHKVFITSESKLPEEFEKYRITIPPHRIHDLLYYAQMLIGDTQTMTTEAGILGTPAIRCNSFVGENDMGNFIELEKKYDLIYSYRDPDKALSKALELLKTDNLKREWQKKREKLLSEKIDVTKFMVEFIENYPRSFHELVHSHKKK